MEDWFLKGSFTVGKEEVLARGVVTVNFTAKFLNNGVIEVEVDGPPHDDKYNQSALEPLLMVLSKVYPGYVVLPKK